MPLFSGVMQGPRGLEIGSGGCSRFGGGGLHVGRAEGGIGSTTSGRVKSTKKAGTQGRNSCGQGVLGVTLNKVDGCRDFSGELWTLGSSRLWIYRKVSGGKGGGGSGTLFSERTVLPGRSQGLKGENHIHET